MLDTEDINSNKKVCPKCLKKKSKDTDFKLRPNGNCESYCRECQVVYFRQYNSKRYASAEARQLELDRGHEKYDRIIKPARMKRKIALIKLMGGKCLLCGYGKSAAALDFDHIDPATKQRTLSHLLAINQPWAWEAVLEEAKKCRLLCSNCHREITYPGHEFSLEEPKKISKYHRRSVIKLPLKD